MKAILLERIYRRLLTEDGKPDTTSYAAVTRKSGERKTATVYRAADLEAALKQNPEMPVDEFIVGYVTIKKDENPCWGAYKISNIIGPGKIMYGLAYAMSPNGRLISDRTSMTTDAKKAWFKMSQKKTRNTLKLDNAKEPQTPETEDDCSVYKNPKLEFLNYAYESEGWEQPMLAELENAHKTVMQNLKAAGIDGYEVQQQISAAGSNKFAVVYRASTGIPMRAPSRDRTGPSIHIDPSGPSTRRRSMT